MTSLVARFRADETGATSIEYALIAIGISVAILAGVQAVGGSVSALYDTVADAVAAQTGP
jgi:pilus assembly protein Flp/PilA